LAAIQVTIGKLASFIVATLRKGCHFAWGTGTILNPMIIQRKAARLPQPPQLIVSIPGIDILIMME
jgi:hypothetical protein